MNQIGTLHLLLQKTERTYHMLLPLGAQFEEAIEAALEFVEEIRKIQSQSAQAAQATPAEPAAVDPSAG